jgi:hypothetical protein
VRDLSQWCRVEGVTPVPAEGSRPETRVITFSDCGGFVTVTSPQSTVVAARRGDSWTVVNVEEDADLTRCTRQPGSLVFDCREGLIGAGVGGHHWFTLYDLESAGSARRTKTPKVFANDGFACESGDLSAGATSFRVDSSSWLDTNGDGRLDWVASVRRGSAASVLAARRFDAACKDRCPLGGFVDVEEIAPAVQKARLVFVASDEGYVADASTRKHLAGWEGSAP